MSLTSSIDSLRPFLYHPKLIKHLVRKLLSGRVSVMLFNFSLIDSQEKYFEYLSKQTENHWSITTLFFGSPKLYEHVLLMIHDKNSIRRNLVYIFHWGRESFNRKHFLRNIHYAMRVYAITNPRNGTFRLYYNQGTSYREHHLEIIKWWNDDKGLFNHPNLMTQKKSVYKDFHGKVLQVPVLHKPPWHFVRYNSNNESFEVSGGRDDRILNLLSKKLNFRYNYSDPPERIQGSVTNDGGSFNGVLGLISQRKADLFIGDMGITSERFGVVEYSFLTLADSGAFVTHTPSRLNEVLALLRPFQWQVWPFIGVVCLTVGPFLYGIIVLPNVWHPRFRVRSHARLFFDCTWFTVTILLKQTGKEPSNTHKARLLIILLSISATYVITDMYSANLTSLLARPGREKAINNLYQLRNVMKSKDFKLFVERHSPSFGLLENGTGIYGQIWELMEQRQSKYVVESVEEGVKLVRDNRNVAVMAGRETLFFDIQRFGAKNFHLSEKLNTAYSAIALQLGCPFIEEINKILMAIFEAGIITKMTENEYEKLGRQQKIPEAKIRENEDTTSKIEIKRIKPTEDDKLQPINLKMFQGCFYLLCLGNIFAGLILLTEISLHKYHLRRRKTRKPRFLLARKLWGRLKYCCRNTRNKLVILYRNFMRDAVILTLDYVE
ncbi:hypothetical protein ABEB36_002337 [Hypothenemus hampei]|uniref:Uncharacterized protein n=1 Tax=Hypothenemus hampei TaxID=57062 RepID=A0ABD1F5F8_HYPHA